MFALEAARLTPNSAKRNVVVFAESKARLTPAATLVDEALGGYIRHALKPTRYQGGLAEMSGISTPAGAISQVLVVGTGKQNALTRKDWWKLGLNIGKALDARGVKEASIALGELEEEPQTLQAALALVEGIHMSLYRFDRFKSELKEHQQPRFEKLTILTSTRIARAIEEEAPRVAKLLDAVDVTRNAVNLPPNIANPEFMAEEARKLEKLGVKVHVIDEKEMKKLGLNLILAVGGSAAPEDQPRLIVMQYHGGKKGVAPTAIVGKGVMFDTGGYNVKTGKSMQGMKYDMAGSAAVLGTMRALAERKAKVNVVGVMGCAMNMIGQNPFLPDSVYKSYKGLNVEIGNTDAEGRLVLADAIAYTIDKFEPAQVVDLATLTGACMVALGGGYAGLFSTSNTLAGALQRSATETGELIWRLPVDDYFMTKSEVADINNDGNPYGGASVGAAFLKKFADKTAWAHIDIAGVANAEKIPGSNNILSGATGFGVRLLTHWLENNLAVPEEGEAPRKRRGRPSRAELEARAAAKASRSQASGGVKRGRGRPRKNANSQ